MNWVIVLAPVTETDSVCSSCFCDHLKKILACSKKTAVRSFSPSQHEHIDISHVEIERQYFASGWKNIQQMTLSANESTAAGI